MCGIVGALSERNITPLLLEGLKRLEYRGYDSAGIALITADQVLQRLRTVGKVSALEAQLHTHPLRGNIGIAHTRWATHGAPTVPNAHPHVSDSKGHSVAVVHNGIIENHVLLRQQLIVQGYHFESDTDTEVIAHLIHRQLRTTDDLYQAVRQALQVLQGAYALAVISARHPDRLIGARSGSPLVVGYGLGEHFLASDGVALQPVTQHVVYLEEGDVVELHRDRAVIYDRHDHRVTRPVHAAHATVQVTKDGYRHYMLKEIFEQPHAVTRTLAGRLTVSALVEGCGLALPLLASVRGVHIIACGTSYHAALVARYWLEAFGIPCMVEVASEYRYRAGVVPPQTLFVSVSQSGETADTLAALRLAKTRPYLATLAICNVAESTLVRESDGALRTQAGPEIGVASTKAFTTQLVALRLFSLAVAHAAAGLSADSVQQGLDELAQVPRLITRVLNHHPTIATLAEHFVNKRHALFLGRGTHYPIALEGALKLKEISYIHAEGYPAGELKHGPLALVDAEIPVVCVLPKDGLLEKVLSNLQEVRARGGELFLFADQAVVLPSSVTPPVIHTLLLGDVPEAVAPLVFAVPLQLLAYYVAVLKGTDVDQPRNLAKAVTVE